MLFAKGSYLWLKGSLIPGHTEGSKKHSFREEGERGRQQEKLLPELLTFNRVIHAAAKEGLEEYNFPPFL